MPRLIKVRDTITPSLRRKAHAVANKKPLLTAMGRQVVSIGKRAFTEPGMRAAKWTARKDKSLKHALLQKSTTLRKSIRITSVGADHVELGSDRPYAAVHQLGSKKKNIPARPFLPFIKKKLTPQADKAVANIIRVYLDKRG